MKLFQEVNDVNNKDLSNKTQEIITILKKEALKTQATNNHLNKILSKKIPITMKDNKEEGIFGYLFSE